VISKIFIFWQGLQLAIFFYTFAVPIEVYSLCEQMNLQKRLLLFINKNSLSTQWAGEWNIPD
jgi:hypothetical protein